MLVGSKSGNKTFPLAFCLELMFEVFARDLKGILRARRRGAQIMRRDLGSMINERTRGFILMQQALKLPNRYGIDLHRAFNSLAKSTCSNSKFTSLRLRLVFHLCIPPSDRSAVEEPNASFSSSPLRLGAP